MRTTSISSISSLLGGFALVAAACSSNVAQEVTPTAAAGEQSATTVATAPASAVEPTAVATAAVGIAPPPLEWAIPAGRYPAGFLEYDPARYVVHERELHGTTVEVAVHEALTEGRLISGRPGMGAEAYSDWVFEVFERYQGVFGGFPFDRYRVVVRGPDDDPIGYFITTEWGLEIAFAGWELDSERSREPDHGYTWPFAQEWTAHEIFHAWNGQFIDWQPDGSDRIFQAETWLAEGATTYYSAAVRRDDLTFLEELLGDAREDVEEAAAEDGWLSFAAMAERVLGPGPNGEPPPYSAYNALTLQKGALVSYLLDVELRARGSSLDAFMRRLYQDFGLRGHAYTQAHLEALAAELAGEDLDWFFAAYVRGAEPLPLDGDFALLP